ncbi:MAG: phosphoribosylaminoimidazolesuccinocarboxamide synthase [Opitutae bacterium]|jgi:phosphoribosylaminoimidazole-succinocarboxamide synthase|nr:phosphoribosylaminoimidazolesuccinocarboxamide synthase [Opitutae bacterium]
MTNIKTPDHYEERIRRNLRNCLTETTCPRGEKYHGKVRDRYDIGDQLLLITTDRQSAFDRVLASIPFKGQVLNLTSAWWFENTKHIVNNHVIEVADPNVITARKCKVLPIEFVVRGYITGSTSTSLWTVYKEGSRNYCGNPLPEGLLKNQKLEKNLLTPTTKEEDHDRPITPEAIVSENWLTQEEWDEASNYAMALFEHGQRVAAENGLILVDTKYEFGRAEDGRILLIDEIHTPDSSRFWIADSYQKRFEKGENPENVDKEFLRLWFKDHCDPYNDKTLPDAPEDLVVELSRRYIFLYEKITGQSFPFPPEDQPVSERITNNIQKFL